ncbi:PA14 domain-containing protein [Massilia pinisoli]|uniref:PA14 domain-containing protein n=1 Tax=Massilia pinisoli TaxID=1772194 RepID=A0ABT1ZZ74_9BURK|nr:PA14 domain-containing protein [Massilia pinisoli]MCS0585232.1 PA14 domain-containing protein [Massilia pinisoli]
MHTMQQTTRPTESLDEPPPGWWRRIRRRALALALVIHLLLLFAFLRSGAAPPAPTLPERSSTVVMIRLPKPPVKKIPEPVASGIKLAARPSVGLPTAKTIERRLTTVPKVDVEPQLTRAAVVDPLPNLAAIDAVASTVATGGTGSAGSGAGSTGSGTGSGAVGKLFEECADAPDRPLAADVYRLPQNTNSVDAMRQRTPIKRVCLSQLDITPRPFRQGFPGLDGLIEWFGLDIRFTVDIASAGRWELGLVSDDGAILSIDGKDVINNDGVHRATARWTQVRLASGVRNFRVRYFQGPREHIALMLVWRKEGDKEFDYIPVSLLGRVAVPSAR